MAAAPTPDGPLQHDTDLDAEMHIFATFYKKGGYKKGAKSYDTKSFHPDRLTAAELVSLYTIFWTAQDAGNADVLMGSLGKTQPPTANQLAFLKAYMASDVFKRLNAAKKPATIDKTALLSLGHWKAVLCAEQKVAFVTLAVLALCMCWKPTDEVSVETMLSIAWATKSAELRDLYTKICANVEATLRLTGFPLKKAPEKKHMTALGNQAAESYMKELPDIMRSVFVAGWATNVPEGAGGIVEPDKEDKTGVIYVQDSNGDIYGSQGVLDKYNGVFYFPARCWGILKEMFRSPYSMVVKKAGKELGVKEVAARHTAATDVDVVVALRNTCEELLPEIGQAMKDSEAASAAATETRSNNTKAKNLKLKNDEKHNRELQEAVAASGDAAETVATLHEKVKQAANRVLETDEEKGEETMEVEEDMNAFFDPSGNEPDFVQLGSESDNDAPPKEEKKQKKHKKEKKEKKEKTRLFSDVREEGGSSLLKKKKKKKKAKALPSPSPPSSDDERGGGSSLLKKKKAKAKALPSPSPPSSRSPSPSPSRSRPDDERGGEPRTPTGEGGYFSGSPTFSDL